MLFVVDEWIWPSLFIVILPMVMQYNITLHQCLACTFRNRHRLIYNLLKSDPNITSWMSHVMVTLHAIFTLRHLYIVMITPAYVTELTHCFHSYLVLLWSAVAQRQNAGLAIERTLVRIPFAAFLKLQHFFSLHDAPVTQLYKWVPG